MKLTLIRHGQTEWNLIGKAQGHTDIPLDADGERQAYAAARALGGTDARTVLTSDLARAYRTAEIVAQLTDMEIEATSLLRERSFGQWEGQQYTWVRERFNELAEEHGMDHEHRPPGGESLLDVWNRLDPVIERLNTASSDLVVVTHGGTCGLILARLIKAPIETSKSLRFGNTAITQLTRRPDGHWSLDRYSDTSHLDVPSAPMIDAANPRRT
jgi:broad specificity phosphatase PhoE